MNEGVRTVETQVTKIMRLNYCTAEECEIEIKNAVYELAQEAEEFPELAELHARLLAVANVPVPEFIERGDRNA